ncbi:CDP-glucose 4,6-dehydratase [Maledivibacter halophilus]|uniref:CDP-glucose 4,6-dehydratase n=1 Tax=Maledivibacter halophilus TaxID=36842 RepID=A0A1T5L1Y7_9FIRM|nr:CDP-glucose 4,6-dehydratase [Maledivibacter halophilus]SKC69920.1 CDP-glucose 4,6-dehydratase [Maledivibacter halophilus]
MKEFNNVFEGKTILVTGHTGFKGSWLSIWLKGLGAEVIGYALDPNTNRDNFILSGLNKKIIDIRGDIRDINKLEDVFKKYKPEIVFHLAAQSLVGLSYKMPRETYEVNLMGTLNILECIRKSHSVKVGIMITSDKCYENKEQLWGYREKDSMGGYDPYSSSKGCSEILINSYRASFMNPLDYKKHGKSIASARAGNVIGGGDWAKDRIIPDCIRYLEINRPIEIRNPLAVRPWQHVLEPLSGYLLLAKRLLESPKVYCEPWNFGPGFESVITVKEMVEKVIDLYGYGEIRDVSKNNKFHEAKLLNLDISKALFKLGWKPKLSIDKALELTIDWYKRYQREDVYGLCKEQIKKYNSKGVEK